MPRTKQEKKLDDSINVPVPKALKQRVKQQANRLEIPIAHTAFARLLIEEGLKRRDFATSAK